MGSREEILRKLADQMKPFQSEGTATNYHHVVPCISDDPKVILTRFRSEAEKSSCIIHPVTDEKQAVETILTLVNGEKTVSGWDFDQIGLASLEDAFSKHGIHLDATVNPTTCYGITAVEAALAATGSVVLASGKGKNRGASLLPRIHIAVVHAGKIIKDLESWLSQKEVNRDNFSKASNIIIISGPSKTADIAMELVLGMHGPQEVHIVLFE